MDDSEKWVRIVHEFQAPMALVWRMWTDPALFQKWYGPMGFSVPTAEIDLRVGGVRKICMEMKTPEKTMRMWFTGVYKEITEPSRLVYTESMCDEAGNILSPKDMGMPEGHPDITEVIVDLRELDGRTQMTMVHRGVPAGSAGEGGWKQAFEKLEVVLAKG
ncbi:MULTISPECIES: SRPBCC domain-containing protein [unclassified Ruegeria]|uniref:SRPBCC family protein n=1 Tax=unclassified Ruegeria TaxID=2625375 RepID=UPI001488107A|nr:MULTISPECIES: SRPBCC domain-containing protein [unclassified Ruegeria]